MTSIDVKSLKNIIEKYRYGQFNILEDDFSIQINPVLKKVALQNFYRNDSTSTTGTCSELVNAAFREINSTYPEYKIIRVMGHDPTYFPKEDESTHYFMTIPCADIIIDPSLKVVMPKKDSGYYIDRIFNEEKDIQFPKDVILGDRSYAPLCLTKNKTMIGLIAWFKFYSGIGILAHKPDKGLYVYDIKDLNIERKLNEPEAMPFIERLRNVNIEETYERLRIRN
ncbi:MAG: hypothetical protein ACP5NW_02505 [Candidatus Woesearchaeota archaeon]